MESMVFADLKNDFVFRRIFATHPDLLRSLLNDLLERTGEQAIESIEYLPSEQLPLAMGAKLSILDVRCRDRSGTTFVVEMQLIHVPGFINRVVYNACKAYVGQLQERDKYTKLTDVVAISICDFELWPDPEQDAKGLPRVPMLSRWHMTERKSGNNGLLQVQYAFLELPKLPAERPESPGADLWAWLFVHAPDLKEIPPDLPAEGAYRTALELANKATFTHDELDAYRRVYDEIMQVQELAEAREARGEAAGLAKGEAIGLAKGEEIGLAKGKIAALLAVLAARNIVVTPDARSRIEACTEGATLDRWIARAATCASVDEVLDGGGVRTFPRP
ncbi:MAG: Rpn family recombination-promoting nuclease/putative transposase [Polyangiaceae bacterium]